MLNASKISRNDLDNSDGSEKNTNTVPHPSVFNTGATILSNKIHDSKTILPLGKLLLWHLLRGSDTWIFNDKEIMSFLGIRKGKLRELFNNLRENGYVVLEKMKDKATGEWRGSRRVFAPLPIFMEEGKPIIVRVVEVEQKSCEMGECVLRNVGQTGSHYNNIKDLIINNKKNIYKKDFDSAANNQDMGDQEDNYTITTLNDAAENSANTQKCDFSDNHTLEQIIEKKEKKSSKNTKRGDYETGEGAFDLFWNEYPLKKARKKAQETFLKKIKDIHIDEILKALRAQKREFETIAKITNKPTFWKHPTTWLNQECWTDEVKSLSEIEKLYGKKTNNNEINLDNFRGGI